MLSENVKCSKVTVTDKHWVWKKVNRFLCYWSFQTLDVNVYYCPPRRVKLLSLQFVLFREYLKSATLQRRHCYALDKCVFPSSFQIILSGSGLVSCSLVWRHCSDAVQTWCLQSNEKEILCKNTKKDSGIIKIENLRINWISYSIINTFWMTSFG